MRDTTAVTRRHVGVLEQGLELLLSELSHSLQMTRGLAMFPDWSSGRFATLALVGFRPEAAFKEKSGEIINGIPSGTFPIKDTALELLQICESPLQYCANSEFIESQVRKYPFLETTYDEMRNKFYLDALRKKWSRLCERYARFDFEKNNPFEKWSLVPSSVDEVMTKNKPFKELYVDFDDWVTSSEKERLLHCAIATSRGLSSIDGIASVSTYEMLKSSNLRLKDFFPDRDSLIDAKSKLLDETFASWNRFAKRLSISVRRKGQIIAALQFDGYAGGSDSVPFSDVHLRDVQGVADSVLPKIMLRGAFAFLNSGQGNGVVNAENLLGAVVEDEVVVPLQVASKNNIYVPDSQDTVVVIKRIAEPRRAAAHYAAHLALRDRLPLPLSLPPSEHFVCVEKVFGPNLYSLFGELNYRGASSVKVALLRRSLDDLVVFLNNPPVVEFEQPSHDKKLASSFDWFSSYFDVPHFIGVGAIGGLLQSRATVPFRDLNPGNVVVDYAGVMRDSKMDVLSYRDTNFGAVTDVLFSSFSKSAVADLLCRNVRQIDFEDVYRLTTIADDVGILLNAFGASVDDSSRSLLESGFSERVEGYYSVRTESFLYRSLREFELHRKWFFESPSVEGVRDVLHHLGMVYRWAGELAGVSVVVPSFVVSESNLSGVVGDFARGFARDVASEVISLLNSRY